MCQISPSLEYHMNSWQDAKDGRPSCNPIMRIQIPTVYDPTLAPEGHHVMSVWVFYEPAHLKDRSWADVRQEEGEKLIDLLSYLCTQSERCPYRLGRVHSRRY